MRTFHLSACAERAFLAFLRPSAASAVRPSGSSAVHLSGTSALRPSAVPSFTVRAASGAAMSAATATGAFRAIRLFSPSDRETVRIYDDDGYCLYR